ncbi:MAG: hypothetical protein M3540_04950 [Actinomycetota bacterium]|nr:hypothetical protein [Actinomycetota bacterium]
MTTAEKHRVRRLGSLLAVLAGALLWAAGPASAAAPVTWCGNDRSSANRAPDVDTGSAARVRVFYATPSDGPDRFGELVSLIATDISAIDEWWRGQDSSRTPRFDLFAFPNCPAGFGQLDIGFARLPRPGSTYVNLNLQQLSTDLVPLTGPTIKGIVYYDGPVTDSDVCGTATRAPDSGGLFGFSFVWLRASDCEVDVGTGRLTAEVAAHEFAHNLGAVPDQAPNTCPENSGHVCDNTSDLLDPFVSSGATIANAILDFGRNDYYGHSGTWWDLQDSLWLMHLPLFPFTVSVTGSPGSVTSDVGSIDCPAACSASIENGTAVTLSAVPGDRSRFLGWGGACTGRGDCLVTADAAKSVTAAFGPGFFALAVKVTGRGVVRSSPSGIACAKSCTRQFSANGTVRLTARPAKGYRFAGWSGDCRGTRDCIVKLDRAKTARATFRKRR